MRTPAKRIGGMKQGSRAPHVVAGRPGRRELQKVVEYRPAMKLDPLGAVHGLLVNLKQALFEIAYWAGFGRTGYLEGRKVRNQTLAFAALVSMVVLVCTSKAPDCASSNSNRPCVMKGQGGTKVSGADEMVTEVTVEGVPPSSETSLTSVSRFAY